MSDERPDAPELVEPAAEPSDAAVIVTDEQAEAASAELPDSPESAEEPAPRMEMAQLKAVIEALVFASPDPITLRTLYKLLSDEPKEDVKAALEALKVDYTDRGGLHMAEVAGGDWRARLARR